MRNKPWLDQTGNHYKIVTIMLIHTWNEHPDIQDNKLNANHLYAQHSTNAQYIKYASRNKILQWHKSENT